jgi:hypothetical protein
MDKITGNQGRPLFGYIRHVAIALTCLLSVVTFSCQRTRILATSSAPPSQTSLAAAATTGRVANTPNPAATSTPSSEANTATPTSEAPDFVEVCPNIAQVDLSELSLAPDQVLLVRMPSPIPGGELQILSPDTGALTPIPNTDRGGLAISPDGQWLLDTRYQEGSLLASLWVIDLSGNERLVLDNAPVASANWLDTQHVLIWELVEEPLYDTYELPTQVLNPFDLALRQLPQFPEMPVGNVVRVGAGGRLGVYIAPSFPEEYWTLYDYDAAQASRLLASYGNYQIDWSADERWLAIVTHGHLADSSVLLNLIDVSGEATIRTIEMPADDVATPLWSSDAQSLAVLIYNARAEPHVFDQELLVFDMPRGQFRRYCGLPELRSNMLWSLDNRFLAAFDKDGMPVILDVVTGQFAVLSDMSFFGWGVAP